MKNQGVFILVVFSALLALSGCVTTGQPSNGFSKMEEEDIRDLEKERTEKIKQEYYSVLCGCTIKIS